MKKYILLPTAPYIAFLMPFHPKNSNGGIVHTPASTGFGKQTYGTNQHYVDSLLIRNDLGKILSKSEWLDILEDYHRAAPNYGIRGGNSARRNADGNFRMLCKENLLVEVDV